ncbi:hypothetical protein Hanom_Chr01g00061561 [Helianthus anomalus]
MLREVVFPTEFGIGLMHLQMKDLELGVWIGAALVSYFASMLNFEEVNRTRGTQPRLFYHTDCFYLKAIDHPKGHEFEEAMPYRLAIEWATAGVYLDCGLFAMRHMETWFRSNKGKMG